MMVIQIVGVLFCLYLLYISYTSFKKEEFSLGDFLIWLAVWLVLLLIFAFPGFFIVIRYVLQVNSLVEIIFTILIAFLVLIVFHMYKKLNQLGIKFEQFIQHFAQEEHREPQKRSKRKK